MTYILSPLFLFDIALNIFVGVMLWYFFYGRPARLPIWKLRNQWNLFLAALGIGFIGQCILICVRLSNATAAMGFVIFSAGFLIAVFSLATSWIIHKIMARGGIEFGRKNVTPISLLLKQIQSTPGCTISPPMGQPQVNEPHVLPEDLQEFYSLCGGITLFADANYWFSIVAPKDFVPANPVVAGVKGEDDISAAWYIIAEQAPQYISIDLHRARLGRCYDSFWEIHALKGDCPIVARSFTDLLARLLQNRGDYLYWLKPEFESMGDAYDP